MTSKALEAAISVLHDCIEMCDDAGRLEDYGYREKFVESVVPQIIRAFAQNISEEALLQMASARNRFLAKNPQAPFETSAAIALRAAIEKDLE